MTTPILSFFEIEILLIDSLVLPLVLLALSTCLPQQFYPKGIQVFCKKSLLPEKKSEVQLTENKDRN